MLAEYFCRSNETFISEYATNYNQVDTTHSHKEIYLFSFQKIS